MFLFQFLFYVIQYLPAESERVVARQRNNVSSWTNNQINANAKDYFNREYINKYHIY